MPTTPTPGDETEAVTDPPTRRTDVPRLSVAAARTSKSNRTQLILGGIAVVIITVIVVVGIVLHYQNSTVPDNGYGPSKSSVATVGADGVITVKHGSPRLTVDIWEDAICSSCGDFEAQYGQQIAKAVDDGQLQVDYHFINALDSESVSKTYSTRSFAALLAVAKQAGSTPGLWMKFHSALFATSYQPTEDGSTDHSNAELATLAQQQGVPATVVAAISNGSLASTATADAAASLKALDATGENSTPTVISGGKVIEPANNVGWLAGLLGAAGY